MHIVERVLDYTYNILYDTTLCGKRVHVHSAYPFDQRYLAKVPALNIVFPAVKYTSEGRLSKLVHGEIAALFVGVLSFNNGAPNTAYTLHDQVNGLIYADQYFGGLLCGVDCSSTEVEDMDVLDKKITVILAKYVFHLTALKSDLSKYYGEP